MNYERVYQDFILDRRLKESQLSAFDRHHILPKCLGGGDESENLIRLSYGDHLFAHAVLAEIHGGVLVSTAARMSGMRKYVGRKSRAMYQSLRNKKRAMMRGRTVSWEAREKIAAKARDRWNNPEYRAQMSEKITKMWTDPQFRERQKASFTEDVRAKRVESCIKAQRNPKRRDLTSDSNRRRWEDPEYRARMVAVLARASASPSDKSRVKMGIAQKGRTKSAEHRAKISASMKKHFSKTVESVLGR